jgi:hypothetical protein
MEEVYFPYLSNICKKLDLHSHPRREGLSFKEEARKPVYGGRCSTSKYHEARENKRCIKLRVEKIQLEVGEDIIPY